MMKCGVIDYELPRLNSNMIKKKIKYRDVPLGEKWKINVGKELLKIRNGTDMELPGFSSEECDELMQYV